MAVFLDPEIQQQLKDKLLSLRDLFDELFSDISPTRTLNGTSNNSDRLDSISIKRHILTDSQCLHIEHLSGFIASAVKYFEDFDIKQLNEVHKILVTCTEYDTVSRLTVAKRRSDRTISLLHDYLKNEINRSEDLANRVKELEIDQVNKTDELLRVRKELQKIKGGLQNKNAEKLFPANPMNNDDMSSTSKAPTDDDALSFDPQSLNGRFIRKKFDDKFYFGLIVNYTAPYYMVVYEDSDYEDLSRKEVQALVWAHEVPAITETNCKKHAKKLKIPAITTTEKVVVGLKQENTSASTIFPTAIDLTDSGDSEIESGNGDGMKQGSMYGIASTPSEGDLDSKISKGSSEKNEISKVVALPPPAASMQPTSVSKLSIPSTLLLVSPPKSAMPMSCPSADMKIQKRQPIASLVAQQIVRDSMSSSPACQENSSSLPSTTAVHGQQSDENLSYQDSLPTGNSNNNHMHSSSSSNSAASSFLAEGGLHDQGNPSPSVQSLKRKRENSSSSSSSSSSSQHSKHSNPTSSAVCVIIDVTDD